MPSLFAITTATNSISLDRNRQGQVSFTVSNTTPQSLRSHARLRAQPTVAEPWLKLLGETERDFASNESQQYTVQISVPPGSSPGEYTFRLNMVEVTDPDETLSEGPTVRFTVPIPPVVKPKPFPWWIVAAVIGAIILLVGGSVGIARLTQKPTPTPTPTAVLLTPTPTPPPLLGSWRGQGTYSNGAAPFNMLLTITTINGDTFSGTLAEDTYASVVNITGHILSSSGGSVNVTFTDPSSVSGNGILLNCTYTATIASGQMNGFWYSPGSSTAGGAIALRATQP